MPLLDVREIDTYYGRVQALRGVSLHVDEGEIVTLIRANGAGKSTTLRTISGLIHPVGGGVFLLGKEITTLAPDRIVGLGVAQAPEGRRLFQRMTVRENLEMGAYSRRERAETVKDIEHVFGIFPRLRERASQLAGTLSGGEQQMLAMGRALMARPKVLLLDEPSMGLSPILVDTIFQTIRTLNEQGTTVLLIEQNARMALTIAARGYVLETGRIVLEDTAGALLKSEMVRKAYLGE
jgi:branched-chain amino acid transport system ATP-binding protein